MELSRHLHSIFDFWCLKTQKRKLPHKAESISCEYSHSLLVFLTRVDIRVGECILFFLLLYPVLIERSCNNKSLKCILYSQLFTHLSQHCSTMSPIKTIPYLNHKPNHNLYISLSGFPHRVSNSCPNTELLTEGILQIVYFRRAWLGLTDMGVCE